MKKFTIIICLLLISLLSVNVLANDTKVVDEYGVFSSSETEELENKIKDEIDNVGFDIVVYIAYEDKEITALADDYFDYNDYGLGNNRDGIILCVNYYDRDYTITTRGSSTITLFSDDALNDIYSIITPYLSDGDNYSAVLAFIEGIDYVYNNQSNYSHHYYSPEESNGYGGEYTNGQRLQNAALCGLGGATITSLIAFFILRGQLKTQGIKAQANNYMTSSGLNLFRSGEIFLYRNVSRTRIPRNDGPGGGGSHTHYSSSGATHGGGGSHHF